MDKHMEICKELNDLYTKKNEDYGNSFSEQFKEYGLLSSVIRLDDKVRRLKQLTNHDSKVKNESIQDSLLDAANYAILTLMEMRGEPNPVVEVKKVKNKVPTVIEVHGRRYVHEPQDMYK